MDWFNSLIAQLLPAVPKPVVRRLSARYIAGETLDDAVAVIRTLNDEGMMATLDVLGEFVTNPEEAERAGKEYRGALARIQTEGLDSNISIKPTQMGLKLDLGLCHRITRSVMDDAVARGNSVRLDMEDSTCTDDTLAVYRRLREEYENVGCVIQAYLRRSGNDVCALAASGANVRLCKGIYVEPEAIAYHDDGEINRSFEALLRTLLAGPGYTAIATHDAALIDSAYTMIEELGLGRDDYEFQMLLGVTEGLRSEILRRGHRLRVYVPFGSHWHPYSLRRLKENPQIAGYALKGILNRG